MRLTRRPARAPGYCTGLVHAGIAKESCIRENAAPRERRERVRAAAGRVHGWGD